MEKISIEIPVNILRSVKLPPNEINERLKQELAVHLYEQGMLTFGKARELAEMSKWDFHELLGKLKIPRRYDEEELNKDMENLKEFN